MKETIHNYPRRLDLLIKRIQTSDLSNTNKNLILGFKDECLVQGLSIGRAIKYIYYLIKLSGWLGKDFDKAGKEDIKSIVGKIEQSDYVDYSKKELKHTIRKFYKWLLNTEEYPEIVNWIKPHSKKFEKLKLPDEMLTEDEISKLIKTAKSFRDKAFISVLYESGCRISEILFLRLKNVKFDEHGAILLIPPMKTGARRIRIVSSVPALTEWINNHPENNDPNIHLWIGVDNRVLKYSTIRTQLIRIAKKAGIKKKVNPHNFRHSRATYLANHLTEAQMKEYFGWTQGSDMAAIYVHLSGRDVDDAILKVYGKKRDEQAKESILTPKICDRCQENNPNTNKFCSRCGLPLDRETMLQMTSKELQRQRADDILDELIKIPEIKDVFISGINEVLHRKNMQP